MDNEKKYLPGTRIIDLTGQVFGRLTVIEFSYRKKEGKTYYTYWKCQCICGNISIKRSNHLLSGRTKSCGCYKKDNGREKGKLLGLSRKGIPNLKNRNGNSSSFNSLWHNYKDHAPKRGFTFSLSQEQFRNLTSSNCFYCGIEPRRKVKPVNPRITDFMDEDYYIANGIDRIDSSKGYEINNVVPCCGDCNKAKSIMGQQEFYEWIERVYHHSIINKADRENELIKLQEELKSLEYDDSL